MRKVAMAALLAAWFSEASSAGTVRVVATGDSLTLHMMQAGALGAALVAREQTYDLGYIAVGGTTAPRYDGLELNPETDSYDDFTLLALAHDPDLVTLMLGTNDALRTRTTPDTFAQFVASMTHILAQYDATGVTVVLATPPPILRPGGRFDLARGTLHNEVLPWIRNQKWRPNVYLLDVNERIQQLPNFESLYVADHLIHLNSAGNRWLAEQYVQGIEAAQERMFPGSAAHLPSINLLDEQVHPPGDTDQDGDVDLNDLNNVRNHFGGLGLGDADGDQDIDLNDLNAVRKNFGAKPGALAVPEPSSLALVVALGLAGLVGRCLAIRTFCVEAT